MLHGNANLKKITVHLTVTIKLIEYIFPAVGVCSNPCVGLICLFLLSLCAEKLKSTQKINTFRPHSPPGNEKLPLLSNPIP